MTWRIVLTPTFKRGYKKKDERMKGRVLEAIHILSSSEDPRRFGVPKHGQLKGTFAYELGSSSRILYAVNQRTREILFLRTCSHAEVYRE
ncbi:MAG: type II toxin-antitoxin system mRNA interferase toxin, RelE/StbE family [Nitrososphaerota archaeon]|nr:type II toxin-antitoxin system mRNA interferase toxin, RelE/StbE family [Nitrososphaerota archaeon]MDG7023257.1 type II toxin-antitoxin system mRNA interferase toxin, RelE/StbE family [Nitrososphaerota archaeon]